MHNTERDELLDQINKVEAEKQRLYGTHDTLHRKLDEMTRERNDWKDRAEKAEAKCYKMRKKLEAEEGLWLRMRDERDALAARITASFAALTGDP